MPHNDIITLNPIDAAFLFLESDNTPAHFGGLEIFSHPKNHRGSLFKDLARDFEDKDEFSRPYNQRLVPGSLLGLRPPRWRIDEHFDFDYHVRHLAVPAPGHLSDLLKVIARIHSRPLDFAHPLWEYYFIDGLQGRRFAIYRKSHHSAIDGVGGLALVEKTYSHSPRGRMRWAPWNPPASVTRDRRHRHPFRKAVENAGSMLTGASRAGPLMSFAADTIRRKVTGATAGLTLPYAAPATPFNVPVSAHRRFDIRTLDLNEMRDVAHRLGGTINDLVVTVCAGALRRYLQDKKQLPEKTLTAGIPVSIRKEGEKSKNRIVFVLCELGTHLRDAGERFRWIKNSMDESRRLLEILPEAGATGFTLAMDAAFMLQRSLSGVAPSLPPIANLVISNVAGSQKPLYMNGARLEGMWPLSLLMDGQALNITVSSYVNTMNFGIIACREAVRDVDRIGSFIEDSFDELITTAG